MYHLEPINIGTPFIEGQASYITRLAEAHSVSVGSLINHEIARVIDLPYLTRCSKYGGNGFLDYCSLLNGYGKWSKDFSSALNELCGLEAALEMTLNPWRDAFPTRDLLRVYRAWCPVCLYEWKDESLPIYEPLLWTIKAVEICSKHRILLETGCPVCNRKVPVLARKSRNGYCSFCSAWLGNGGSVTVVKEEDYRLYYAVNIERLLGKHIGENASLIFINEVIKASGSLCTFVKKLGVSKSTASGWLNNQCKPTIISVLRLCYLVGVNADNALGLLDQYDTINIPLATPIKSLAKKRKISWASVETQLRDICNLAEESPPSVREVARKLGLHQKLLYLHFPEMCKEISHHHYTSVLLQKKNRIEIGNTLIQETINSLDEMGIYPSRRSIERLVPAKTSLREEVYRELWHEQI